jgi:beta-lactamase class A
MTYVSHMMSHFLAKYIMTPVLTRRSMLMDSTSGRYVEWINRMLEHLTNQQKHEFLRNRF